MALAALKKCANPMCFTLVRKGKYCPAHHVKYKQPTPPKRKASAAYHHYYGPRWAKRAARYRRANPLCAICLEAGQVTAAACVDHIEPHRGDKVLFWNQRNWQSLCKSCHSRKTMRERATGHDVKHPEISENTSGV